MRASLRNRVLLSLLALALGYMLVYHLVQSHFLLPQFLAMEEGLVQEDLARVQAALDQELDFLEKLCHDWAAWDDTYEFVREPTDEYRQSNLLPETYLDSKLNLLAIYDLQGRQIAGDVYDLETGLPIGLGPFSLESLPPSHPLMVGSRESKGIHGLWQTPGGTMLLSARPILTSDNAGPPRGTFLMGRLLTEDRARQLARQTATDARFHRVDSPGALDPDEGWVRRLPDGRLRVARVLSDLTGQPALEVSVLKEPTLSIQVRQAMTVALLAVAGACAALVALVLMLLQKTVVGPLASLTAHAVKVGSQDDLSARLDLERRDEVGILASQFDQMLDRLQASRMKLEAHREQLRQLARQLALTEQRQYRRLAASLHDGINQNLFALKAKLAQMRSAGADCQEQAKAALKIVDQTMIDVRNMSMGLHPPVLRDLGLGAALEWLAEQTSQQFPVRCTARSRGDELLGDDMAGTLYQAARELVTNAVKHARAKEIQILLEAQGAWARLSVRDDGVGLDLQELTPSEEGGFGLFSLRETIEAMGGKMEISSGVGKGCEVILIVGSSPGPSDSLEESKTTS